MTFAKAPTRPKRDRTGEFENFTPRARKAEAAVAPPRAPAPAVSKQDAWRSEGYRRFVASFPCFGCGIENRSQCAHEEAGKGKAMKTDDRRTFPLCADMPLRVGCHTQHSLLVDMTRDERRDVEAMYCERMLRIARDYEWFKEAT
jgi:hypothetical protein